MKDSRLLERLREGHTARQQGRTEDALRHYREAIETDPGSAEAHTVYGLMLLLLDRTAEAEGPLRRAMELDPSRAECRVNFSRWLVKRGELEEAAALVGSVAEQQPTLWWAWDRLADIELRRSRFGEAAAHFAKAAKLRADDPAVHFKWARACFDAGRHMEALRILETAGRLAPGQETVFRLRTEIFQAMAEWIALGQAAKEWIEAHPKSWEAWRCLAKAQLETGYLRQAMETYRQSLALGGRDADALATYGRLCLSALEYDAAARALDDAEKLEPRNSHMLSGKAILLMFRGQTAEAEQYCRRALAVNPGDVAAYKTLVQLTDGHVTEAEFAALEALASRESLRIEDRIAAGFALGDCLDARGRHAEAFAAWERANGLQREQSVAGGFAYDPALRTRQTGDLIAAFPRVPAARQNESDPRPVFIVGMPRSGTTLIESVIGAHSKVLACGERPAMRWILADCLDEIRRLAGGPLPEELLARWRQVYWRELPSLDGATVVTDKNPWNFDAIGLILQLFPDAVILHVQRDPLETAFSIWRNEFSKLTAFAQRLEDIAHFHGQYRRLMAHWERVAPGRITSVRYETFLERFETAGPELLAACGLEWEPACASYFADRRVIATMSAVQARRPPGPPSGRAAVHARELAPLRDALGAQRLSPTSSTDA